MGWMLSVTVHCGSVRLLAAPHRATRRGRARSVARCLVEWDHSFCQAFRSMPPAGSNVERSNVQTFQRKHHQGTCSRALHRKASPAVRPGSLPRRWDRVTTRASPPSQAWATTQEAVRTDARARIQNSEFRIQNCNDDRPAQSCDAETSRHSDSWLL